MPDQQENKTNFLSKLKILENLEDYPLWATRLKVHLISAGLWHEKTSQPTDENATLSLLLSYVSDLFLAPLMDQPLSASLVWKTLHGLYHVSNLSTKVTSLNHLINFQFQGSTMLQNRTLLQEAKRKISSSFGGATSITIDELVMIFALVNLPSNYSHLRSQLSISTPDKTVLTLDTLFTHLSREESTLNASTSHSGNSAHRATVTRPSINRSMSCPHGRLKDTCFTCTPSSRPTCPICKGLGIAKFRHAPDSKFCREQRALKPAPQTGLPPAPHGPSPAANYASSSLSFNVDSGATNHVVCNKDAVEIYSLNSLPISIADGRLIPTTGLASFSSQPPLSDILVAPTFTQNLLSTYQLAKTGFVTAFDEHNVYIGKGLHLDELVAQGTQHNGSYHLTLESATTSTTLLSILVPSHIPR